MTKKQLFIVLFSSTISLLLMMVGVVVIYEYNPTILGMMPRDTEEINKYKIDPEETVVVSGSELIELEKQYDSKLELQKKFNILKSELDQIQEEYDSFKKNTKSKLTKADSISAKFSTLAKKRQNIMDSLNKVQDRYKSVESQLEKEKKKTEDLVSELSGASDSLQAAKFKVFAKIYDNSSPEEVAKILEQIDAEKSAAILKLMSKKKAGKVIEVLNKEYAAKVLLKSGE